MHRLLQINPVIRRNTSTGKIMQEIGELAMKNGWESYIAYSGGRDGADPDACKSKIVPVGSKLSVALHGLETRLFDRHGLGSRLATRRFVRRLEEIDPDIIHIHNIHGYFLNYKILFEYLARSGKPVVWTVHDCWLYTGHCFHYASADCHKWQSVCEHCPQKKSFPASYFWDRSKQNFTDKKNAFTSVPDMTIVTVSDWMKGEMVLSFLKDCKFKTIHNGIDLNAFKPCDTSSVREKYGLGDRHIILGLASIWMKEKGLDDFVKMFPMLNDDEVIVLVGKMTPEQKSSLPEGIVTISRTENVQQLAELYSAADAFVNPTWQDNYPTVNLESIACGTPVVTYRTGGSVEAVVEGKTGYVVEQGNVEGLLEKVRETRKQDKVYFKEICRNYAEANFSKEDRYKDYIELYESLTSR